jgi:hypothetical protein
MHECSRLIVIMFTFSCTRVYEAVEAAATAATSGRRYLDTQVRGQLFFRIKR